MAKWSGNKVNPEQINNGNEYSVNDNVSIEELNGIVNNSLKAQEDAERALELAEGANEANGTVVKINGEPQGTWDATFSQKLYEESKNLYNKNSIIKGRSLSGANGNDVENANYFISSYINIEGLSNLTISGRNQETDGIICLYDANYNFINPIYGVKNGTINLPNNAKYLRFEDKITYVNNNIQLEKGTEATDYQPYNAKLHITNVQADLLKSEFEKSKNKFDISRLEFNPNYANATINSNGTITVNQRGNTTSKKLGTFADLVVGETYIFTLKTTNTDKRIYLQQSEFTWYSGEPRTITETDLNSVVMFYGVNNETHTISEIMISKHGGEYQEYNGEIIHKKDITPVLLWENATPNSSMEAGTTVNLTKNIDDFSFIRIMFKQVNNQPHYQIGDYKFNENTWNYSLEIFTATYRRNVIRPTNNTLYFEGGYSGSTPNNNYIIPIKIYGIKEV